MDEKSENFDKERVLETIRVIKKNKKLIDNANIKNVELLKTNIEKYYFISMALFNVMNYLIELSDQIIEILNLEYPTKYVDIPKILVNNQIIDSNSAKKLKELIEYRNSIAHEYDEIFEDEVFWCINNLEIIDIYIELIKKKVL